MARPAEEFISLDDFDDAPDFDSSFNFNPNSTQNPNRNQSQKDGLPSKKKRKRKHDGKDNDVKSKVENGGVASMEESKKPKNERKKEREKQKQAKRRENRENRKAAKARRKAKGKGEANELPEEEDRDADGDSASIESVNGSFSGSPSISTSTSVSRQGSTKGSKKESGGKKPNGTKTSPTKKGKSGESQGAPVPSTSSHLNFKSKPPQREKPMRDSVPSALPRSKGALVTSEKKRARDEKENGEGRNGKTEDIRGFEENEDFIGFDFSGDEGNKDERKALNGDFDMDLEDELDAADLPFSSVRAFRDKGKGKEQVNDFPREPTSSSRPDRSSFFSRSDFNTDRSRLPANDLSGPRGKKRKFDDASGPSSSYYNEWGSSREASRNGRNRGSWEKERLAPWVEKSRVRDELGMERDGMEGGKLLHSEILLFISYISAYPFEIQLRKWTIELIERSLRSRWGDQLEVKQFGSGTTGLCLPGGDIDLVLLLRSMLPTKNTLYKIAGCLQSAGLTKGQPIVIAKAKVPIVKFETKLGGYRVDISINQENGVRAAQHVSQLLDSYRGGGAVLPRVSPPSRLLSSSPPPNSRLPNNPGEVDYGAARCLILLIKMFLAQRGMNEVYTGGLGSYSVICLVVSFLQTHPKIQSGEISPSRNLGVLFIEFLELYGRNFNYDDCGISIRGRGGYYSKMRRGWSYERQPYLLSVEDPNDPSNDVSKGSHQITRVRHTLSGAFDVVTATVFQLEADRAARSDPTRPRPAQRPYLPTATLVDGEPSILGSIFGLENDMIKKREDNLRLWMSGKLQQKLGIPFDQEDGEFFSGSLTALDSKPNSDGVSRQARLAAVTVSDGSDEETSLPNLPLRAPDEEDSRYHSIATPASNSVSNQRGLIQSDPYIIADSDSEASHSGEDDVHLNITPVDGQENSVCSEDDNLDLRSPDDFGPGVRGSAMKVDKEQSVQDREQIKDRNKTRQAYWAAKAAGPGED